MVDLYIDMNHPHPDTLADCKLSGLKDAYIFITNHDALSDSFILTKVVSCCGYFLDQQITSAMDKAVS